jgi:hypothetical protein
MNPNKIKQKISNINTPNIHPIAHNIDEKIIAIINFIRFAQL